MISGRDRRSLRATLIGVAVVVLWGLVPAPATALVEFDFEPPYLAMPQRQVWDFCVVRPDSVYHAFYHTIRQDIQHPAQADTIWHAVSEDMHDWEVLGAALTVGPEPCDANAMWAPDVVFDDVSGRWAMLYTGVDSRMIQRACLAWSDDLATWTKSPLNPVFEPDSLTYHWSPTQNWSSFRDPFVYHDGAQWIMLTTAGLRLGGYPGYRRAIVHRAVSPDLESWQDGGVFFEHDGATGLNQDFESVQYLVRQGWHHLFFVEQDLSISNHPTSHMVASDPSGWTMAERSYVDAGWAPEIKRFDADAPAEVFARLTKDLDPRDATWFVAARFDSVRFLDGGQRPEISVSEGPGADWPVRTGSAGLAAPTYSDNPLYRLDPGLGPEGNGLFASAEFYGGPLSGIGWPGAARGDTATGRLESRPFTVTGSSMRLLLAGGHFPETCYVALVDTATAETLTRLHPADDVVLRERIWDLRKFTGRTVRLVIVDAETGPGGWIAVDGIRERMDAVSPVSEAPVITGEVRTFPNPFNGAVEISCTAPREGRLRLEIFDVRGRRVWRSDVLSSTNGQVSVTWHSRDLSGRALPSGTYLARLLLDGIPVARARLSLIE